MFQLFFQISFVIKIQFVCSSSFVYLLDPLYNKSRTKAMFYVFHSITKNIWLPLSFIFHTRMHILGRKHMLLPVILNYSVSSGNTVTDTINLGRTATLQKKQNRTSGPSSWKMTAEQSAWKHEKLTLLWAYRGDLIQASWQTWSWDYSTVYVVYENIFLLNDTFTFLYSPINHLQLAGIVFKWKIFKNNLHALCNMNRAVHQPIHEKNSLVPRKWINWWLREHEITGWIAVISKSRHLFFQKELNM